MQNSSSQNLEALGPTLRELLKCLVNQQAFFFVHPFSEVLFFFRTWLFNKVTVTDYSSTIPLLLIYSYTSLDLTSTY